jgi:peptide deformylase
MILPIVLYGHPALRKKGRPVGPVTGEIRQLAADMLETMHAAEGVGLAAQQVGVDLQLTVIDIPAGSERPSRMWIGGKPADYAAHMPLVLLDPEITITKTKDEDSEGCLSFPGLTADIRRGARVKVRCRRLDGKPFTFEADGLLGRAV